LAGGGFVKSGPMVQQGVRGDLSAYVLSPAPIPSFGWTSTADARARNKYLSKARNAQQSMSAPTFLGELRQTYHMLRRPAAALLDSVEGYYAALRKRKRYDPINWAKAAHGLWLEYSFGWLPFMADIAGAKQALERLFERDSVRAISASAIDSSLRSYSLQTNSASSSCPNIMTDRTIMTKEQLQVRYRGAVLIHAATTLQQKAALWGFDPSEFLPTAWELLPWSFLIDYFASIGDFLDANGTYRGDIIWTAKTERRKTIKTVQHRFNEKATHASIPNGAYIGSSGSNGLAVYTITTITRSAVPTPLPALYIKWAGPGWGQDANMSALFGQFCSNLHSQHITPRNYRL